MEATSDNSQLYVGDLSPNTTQTDLAPLFATVAPCSIKLCSTSASSARAASNKYAYITYATAEQAAAAIERFNHCLLHGRSMRVMLRVKMPLSKRDGQGNLFVCGLYPSVDNRMLEQAFGVFGKVLSAKVVVDEAGQSRGYGFCQFEDPLAAEVAIAALHGSTMLGNPLVVSHFRRKRPEPGSDRPAVVVRNLPREFSAAEVKELFGAAGARGGDVAPQRSPWRGGREGTTGTVDGGGRRRARQATQHRRPMQSQTPRRPGACAGPIKRVRLVRDESGGSRGVAFVTFTEAAGIKAAVDAFNDYSLRGSKLSVMPAQRSQQQAAEAAGKGGAPAGDAPLAATLGGQGSSSGSSLAGAGNGLPAAAAPAAAPLPAPFPPYSMSPPAAAMGLTQQQLPPLSHLQQQQQQQQQEQQQQLQQQQLHLAGGGAQGCVGEEHSRNTLYVRPLQEGWDEAALRELFQPYGTVMATKVLRTPYGASRGAGFVEFASHEHAVAALAATDGLALSDRVLRVTWAVRRPRSASGPAPPGLYAGPGGPVGLYGPQAAAAAAATAGAAAQAAAGGALLLPSGGLLPAAAAPMPSQALLLAGQLQPMLMGAMPFFVMPPATGYPPYGTPAAAPGGEALYGALPSASPPMAAPVAPVRGATAATPRPRPLRAGVVPPPPPQQPEPAAGGGGGDATAWPATGQAAEGMPASPAALTPAPAPAAESAGALLDRPPVPSEPESGLPRLLQAFSLADPSQQSDGNQSRHSSGQLQPPPPQTQHQQPQQRQQQPGARGGGVLAAAPPPPPGQQR
eukprot:scaffold14.g1215.t1